MKTFSSKRVAPRPDVTGTTRPIVGIVAQTTYGKRARHGPSYFAASYVKYLESAGARVVPVKINQTEEYYTVGEGSWGREGGGEVVGESSTR